MQPSLNVCSRHSEGRCDGNNSSHRKRKKRRDDVNRPVRAPVHVERRHARYSQLLQETCSGGGRNHANTARQNGEQETLEQNLAEHSQRGRAESHADCQFALTGKSARKHQAGDVQACHPQTNHLDHDDKDETEGELLRESDFRPGFLFPQDRRLKVPILQRVFRSQL